MNLRQEVIVLSGKLIHLIETHEEEISAAVLAAIRHRADLPVLGSLPELELRELCREILKNLGHWLTRKHEEELDVKYESVGKLRSKESVPLDECVLGLCILKDQMLAFLDAQEIAPDTLALYA